MNFRLDKDTVRSNALPNQRDRTARAEGAVGIGVRSSSLQDESKFINAHRPRPLYRPRCFLWMSRGVFALRPSLESHWSLQSSLFIAECSPFVGHSEERLGLSTFGVGSYWIWRQFGAAKLFSLDVKGRIRRPILRWICLFVVDRRLPKTHLREYNHRSRKGFYIFYPNNLLIAKLQIL